MPASAIAQSAGRAGESSPLGRRRRRTLVGFVVAAVVLVVAAVLSLMVGARTIPPADVLDALLHPTRTDPDTIVVIGSRLPRTLLGLAAGLALGLAGTVMQGLSRNPLADPGILGVNAGAAFAIAIGIAVFGLRDITSLIWLSFAGALVVTIGVTIIGSSGRGPADPLRLTLAGVALGAVFAGATTGMTLSDPDAFDRMTLALERYQVEDPEFAQFSSKYDAFVAGRATFTPQELNDVTWLKVSSNLDIPNVVGLIKHAAQLEPKSYPVANTLAGVEAETGDLHAAVADLRKAVDLDLTGEITASDWYVLGRILEQAGVRDDAIAAYRRVPKTDRDVFGTDIYTLATTRLKALGGKR